MPTYLAERYWPGVTPASAAEVTALLEASGTRVAETILAEDDEVCFWTVTADSASAVERAFQAAGAPIHRVTPAAVTRR